MAAKKKQTREEIVKHYQGAFKSPSGQQVLLDLMRTHGILNPVYNGDVNAMLVAEGERRVVLRILNILKIDVAALKERAEDV